MKSIGQKIEFLREREGLTQNALAKIIGVSPAAISNWEAEISKPKANSSIKLAEFFMVTLDSLTNSNLELKLEAKMVSIPFYSEVEASAGNGFESVNETYENLSIQASFLSNPNPKSTIALKIRGDSMEPIFIDGSVVFIDRANTAVVDGRVYVFVHAGLVRMKILERIPKGFRMKSYNASYPPEDIDIKYEPMKVIGRVVGQLQMYCEP